MSLNNEAPVAAPAASDYVNEYRKRLLLQSETDSRNEKKARVSPELGQLTKSTIGGICEKEGDAPAAPFFLYKDYSREIDPDPLTPLTAPGRVPNFPAKMHAILSRSDLSDVVAWMPHGRSWRVLKPREFELRVIPTYFEHSKFSSFIRQANGWGFRRLTQGRDRNSYYHEFFLRGLPHLCKKMKRPGVAEKGSTDAEHEPDFGKISEIFPVPVKSDDDSILLQCTVTGGPKARMPIYSGAYLSSDKIRAIHGESDTTESAPYQDQASIVSFQNSLSASENQIRMQPPNLQQYQHQQPIQHPLNPMLFFPQGFNNLNKSQPIMQSSPDSQAVYQPMPPVALHGHQGEPVSSQFAAGFAAATALSNNSQIRNALLGGHDAVNQSVHPNKDPAYNISR